VGSGQDTVSDPTEPSADEIAAALERDAKELKLLQVTAKAARPFGLTHRQIEFAMFYLQCGNETKAALDAGYAKHTAEKKGYVLLRHPKVAAFVKDQLEQRFNSERMQVPEILARIARIARADPRKLFRPDGTYKPIHEMDEETAACIRGWEDTLSFDKDGAPPEMTRKIKFADPLPALRTLAQVSQLLAPEMHTTNVFIDLDSRLDAAAKRLKELRNANVEDAKVVAVPRR
jgi:phage terminase small subunit